MKKKSVIISGIAFIFLIGLGFYISSNEKNKGRETDLSSLAYVDCIGTNAYDLPVGLEIGYNENNEVLVHKSVNQISVDSLVLDDGDDVTIDDVTKIIDMYAEEINKVAGITYSYTINPESRIITEDLLVDFGHKDINLNQLMEYGFYMGLADDRFEDLDVYLTSITTDDSISCEVRDVE